MDYAIRNVQENQGPVAGWFMWGSSPLMQSIDLALMTDSQAHVCTSQRFDQPYQCNGGSKMLQTWSGWRKQGCLFVPVDDDQAASHPVCFFAYNQGQRGREDRNLQPLFERG